MVVNGHPVDQCIDWPGLRGQKGYGHVYHNGKRRHAHRVALVLATGEDPPTLQAAHSCGRRQCVNPAHLRWATNTENMADKKVHGTQARGAEQPNARLTEEQALAAYLDPRSYRVVAAELGVSRSTVQALRAGRNWAWLTGHNDEDTA